MSLTPITLCDNGGPITATYDNTNEFLDGNDILLFYLHEGSGPALINPLDFHTSPVFHFDFATMQGRKTTDRVALQDWQHLVNNKHKFNNLPPALFTTSCGEGDFGISHCRRI